MTIFHIIGYWYLALALIAIAAFFTGLCVSYVREIASLVRGELNDEDAPNFDNVVDEARSTKGGL